MTLKMEKIRMFLYRLLDVPFVVIFLLALLCSVLLTIHHYVGLPFAVQTAVYVLTAYTLVLAVYWLWLFVASKRLQRELQLLEILQKKSEALAFSLELNFLFALYNIYSAIRYRSLWFASMALFYMSLTVGRFIMLRAFRFESLPLREQYKRYISMGYIILAMIISTSIMINMVVLNNYSVSYPGLTIYFAAAFSIYLIITSVFGYFRNHHFRSPLLSAMQLLSIPAALLGILSLQTAFLPHLLDDLELIRTLHLFTGFIIFSLMIVISAYMIVHGTRELKYGIDEQGHRILPEDRQYH